MYSNTERKHCPIRPQCQLFKINNPYDKVQRSCSQITTPGLSATNGYCGVKLVGQYGSHKASSNSKGFVIQVDPTIGTYFNQEFQVKCTNFGDPAVQNDLISVNFKLTVQCVPGLSQITESVNPRGLDTKIQYVNVLDSDHNWFT